MPTTAELIRRGARQHGARTALYCGDELVEHCRGLLAGYKVPKAVHFVDEIPKSPVGKLLRRAVRDALWAGSEEGRARPL